MKRTVKQGASLPFANPTIRVRNSLTSRKKIHVILTPNADYALVDLFVGLAGLASGGWTLATSPVALMSVLRTFSLMKDARKIFEKLKEAMPEMAITLEPGQELDVYNAYTNWGLWSHMSIVKIIELFGGSTLTMIVTDEDFEHTVMFQTPVDSWYNVTEDGVGDRGWNTGFIPANLRSSAPPTLVNRDGEILLLYKHDEGNRIFIASFENGNFHPKGQGWFLFDTSSGLGAAEKDRQLVVFGRHEYGKQLQSLSGRNYIPWDKSASIEFMGPDVEGKISTASFNGNIMSVAKHTGDAAMWSLIDRNWQFHYGNTMIDTSYPPAVCYFKDGIYMVYTDLNTKELKLARTNGRGKWNKHVSLGHYTSAGPAACVYQDKLYVFYRDSNGNGLFYTWSDDGFSFHELRYCGFDIEGEPTAIAVPGGNGILIAGITANTSFLKIWSSKDMVWSILDPKTSSVKRSAKKAGPKSKTKAAAPKKPAKAIVKPAAKKKTAAKVIPVTPKAKVTKTTKSVVKKATVKKVKAPVAQPKKAKILKTITKKPVIKKAKAVVKPNKTKVLKNTTKKAKVVAKPKTANVLKKAAKKPIAKRVKVAVKPKKLVTNKTVKRKAAGAKAKAKPTAKSKVTKTIKTVRKAVKKVVKRIVKPVAKKKPAAKKTVKQKAGKRK